MSKRKPPRLEQPTDHSKNGVFISWSGEQSRQLAEALRSLIPNVFQDVATFVSSNDIDAGTNWFGTILNELANTEFGILCLTADNLTKPWIQFEAGALAKTITDKARVVPYLLAVSKSDLAPPLSLFQGVTADKAGTLELLQSLNNVRISSFEQEHLQTIFDKWWPDYEKALKAIPSPSHKSPAKRSELDLLQEVLQILRAIQTSGQLSPAGSTGPGLMAPSDNPLTRDSLRVQLLLKLADMKMATGDVTKMGTYSSDLVMFIRRLENELSRF